MIEKGPVMLTAAEIEKRVADLPKIATGLLLPPKRFEQLLDLEPRTTVTLNGINITSNPFLPPHQGVWMDSAGMPVAVWNFDDQTET